MLNQDGQSTSLPATDPTGGWEMEEALDVEWIHAIAPGAQIILVEANSQSLSDLMSSVVTAANQPDVSVVSMSWGLTEGQSVTAQDEALYDQDLTTPVGHQGVSFVASTGDYGAADPEYPAFSPNVVAVGGTSLYLNADNSYNSETGWGYLDSGVGQLIGGGGGASQFEAEPTYQLGVQSTGFRTSPDVSFLADPATGAWIADPYNVTGGNPFEVVGGTSLAAPSWAGLLALANQGRVSAGETTLGSASDPTATQEALYSLPASDFNSVTTGSNGYDAAAGYNLVTGLGTPQANLLIPDLISYSGPINFAANAGNATVTSATLAEYTSGTFFGGTANAFQESDALLVHFAGRGDEAMAAPVSPTAATAVNLSTTPPVAATGPGAVLAGPGALATVQAFNPGAGFAARFLAVGDITASPMSIGGITNAPGITVAQSATRVSLFGSPPDLAGRRTTDGGAGDGATFVDGSPDATATSPAAALTDGETLPILEENAAPGFFQTTEALSTTQSAPTGPKAAAFADLVLPCDAFFSLHGNESSTAGGWTFRLADVSHATEDLAVSAAVLAVLFSGASNERTDRDGKQNRLGLLA